MINWKVRLLPPDSHKTVSGIPGEVQYTPLAVLLVDIGHLEVLNSHLTHINTPRLVVRMLTGWH